MKILLVLNSLQMGGAQRAALQLADGLQRAGNSVALAVFSEVATDFFSAVEPLRIERFSRGSSAHRQEIADAQARAAISHRWRARLEEVPRWLKRISDVASLRAYISETQPDVVLAFESYMGVLVYPAVVGSPARLAVAERVHPGFQPVPRYIRHLRPWVLRAAHGVTAQSNDIANWMVSEWRLPAPEIIPNIVKRPVSHWRIQRCVPGRILGLGRYCEQKGIDIAIRAVSQLAAQSTVGIELVWHGSGDPEPYAQLAKGLGVLDLVTLGAPVTDVEAQLMLANVFVMPSRYEGFPNALAEALAHGVPCVATKSPGATGDFARDRAILVPPEDPTALADAVRTLITNPGLAQETGVRGLHLSDEYSEEVVLRRWSAWLERVAATASRSDRA